MSPRHCPKNGDAGPSASGPSDCHLVARPRFTPAGHVDDFARMAPARKLISTAKTTAMTRIEVTSCILESTRIEMPRKMDYWRGTTKLRMNQLFLSFAIRGL